MFDTHSPRQNRLLAALPAEVSKCLFSHREQHACKCYADVREGFARQLPYPLNRTVASAAAQGFEHSASGDWHAHLHAPDFIDARKRQ